MHGEVRRHDARMSDEAFESERQNLQPAFHSLLRKTSPSSNPGGWAKVVEEMAFEMEETGGLMAPENMMLPAAYTYFGQLIAHDITAHRFFGNRRPTLRLRTLYGMGPATSPQYYQHDRDEKDGYAYRGVKMVLDQYKLTGDGNKAETISDFFRVSQKGERSGNIPLMADARNDQNFITSQLLVKFAQLHNNLAELYYDRNSSQGTIFDKASRKLIRKYQRVILTDYLQRILHPSVDLQKLVDSKFLFDSKVLNDYAAFKVFKVFENGAEVECRLSEVFARAAMRYGHTQVRQMYQVQLQRQQRHLFSGKADLGGFQRDTNRKIDWICLLDEIMGLRAFQAAKAFDTKIVLPLANLPFLPEGNRSLIEKNIENSYQNFILDQDFEQELNNSGVAKFLPGNLSKWQKNANGTVPLWIYLLLEAEDINLGAGKTLGPLGSQIVAEQIVWCLLSDPESVLNEKDEEGKIKRFDLKAEAFTLKELLEYAGEEFDTKADLMPDYWKNLKAAQSTVSAPLVHKTVAAAPLAATAPPTGSSTIYLGDEPGLTYIKNGNAIEFNHQRKDILAGEDGLKERNDILKNGHFWYPSNEPPATINAQIANGTLPLDALKKREVRCYISAQMILNLCGNNAPTLVPTNEIKGLFFICGLDLESDPLNPQVCLLARRTGINGTLPSTAVDQWLGSNEITVKKPTNLSTAKPFVDTFVIDQFSVFKFEGLPTQTFALHDLLGLLGYPTASVPNHTVKVKLISATGQETATGENFALIGDEAQIANTSFFALTLEAGTTVVGSGRPYPYFCYPT